ncbi:MAG: serine/threonine-protein kinase, partial [Polyangiaceae bacterium]
SFDDPPPDAMVRPLATTRSTGNVAPGPPRPASSKNDTAAIAPTAPAVAAPGAANDSAFDPEDQRPTGNVDMKATQLTPPLHDDAPPVAIHSAPRFYRAGDVIDGKYRLEGLLGKGGMGEVWTAHNETLGVLRALKLIPADLDSPESTDRLLHEARAAARLADPAIVRVFDFGKTPWGDPYLVMELLSGEDLASVIRRRERLSATKAVRVLLPILRALCAAHAHGIVHRDLKPENIFLSKQAEGRVQPKLLDFGIAKLKNARALRLTTDGTVIGSPLYMSPEQARGDEVDERTDVWALCVVLYEVIAGTPPFVGDDRHEVIKAAAFASPASLKSRGVDEEELWGIIEQGLSKRPEQRWSSVQALGEALAHWLIARKVLDDVTGASIEAAWLRRGPSSILNSLPPPELMMLPEVVIKEAQRAKQTAAQAADEAEPRGWVAPLARLRRALDVEPLRRVYAAFEQRTTPKSRRVIGAVAAFALLAVVLLAWPAKDPAPSVAPASAPTVAAPSAAPAPGPEPASAAAASEPPPAEVAPAPAPTASASAAPRAKKATRAKVNKKPVEQRREKLLNPFHQ